MAPEVTVGAPRSRSWRRRPWCHVAAVTVIARAVIVPVRVGTNVIV